VTARWLDWVAGSTGWRLRYLCVVVVQRSLDHHTKGGGFPCGLQALDSYDTLRIIYLGINMEVHSIEENPSASALSSSQMQQFIRTNEALLKTNESLTELVISVVELLKDPTRHASYGEPFRKSDWRTHAQHQKASSLSLSYVPHPISPSASVRDTSGTIGTLLGEDIRPMTFEEIDAETAMYRQKYEGGRFFFHPTKSKYIPHIARCWLIVDDSHKWTGISFCSGTSYTYMIVCERYKIC